MGALEGDGSCPAVFSCISVGSFHTFSGAVVLSLVAVHSRVCGVGGGFATAPPRLISETA